MHHATANSIATVMNVGSKVGYIRPTCMMLYTQLVRCILFCNVPRLQVSRFSLQFDLVI